MSGLRGFSLMPEWIASYRREWLTPDIVAGLTAAAVVLPKALAYATVAGVPLQAGLYTVFVPMAVYALLGSSRPLSMSTTTTIAILTGTGLAEAAPGADEAAARSLATLGLMVGAALVLSAILRLGFVADFISAPVLIGFKAGIGVVIVVDQIPKVLGIHVQRAPFVEKLGAIARELPHTSISTLAVSVSTIVLLVALRRFAPRFPAPLLAVAGGIAGSWLLDLKGHGVGLIGAIPKGLPGLTMPDLLDAERLWPAAVGIALMSFTETIASGRAFARNDEPAPRANRELFATGVANACGSLTGAMPSGGGTSQTAVNRLAGAKTQVAELVTAGVAFVTMLFLAPLFSQMPEATLAAVVIVYSIGLVHPADFREVLIVRRTEFIWALVALAGVVLVGTLKGILVAIIVSLAALAYQVADPPVFVLGRKRGTNVFRPLSNEHSEDETYPGLLILKVVGRVFFANAGQIGRKLTGLIQEAKPKVVVLDLSGVIDVEFTALKMLTEAEKRYRDLGIKVWLVELNPEVLSVVRRSQLSESLGSEGLFFNVETAIARYLEAPADAIAR